MNANLTHTALRRRSATAISAMLLALGVAACSGTTAVRYDDAHPIEVVSAAEMLELPANKTLSSYDAARVSELGRDYLKRGEGEVTIAYPRGKKSNRVVNEAVNRLVAVGVSKNKILRGPYNTKVDGDRGVVVSFYGPGAKPIECPRHPGDPNLDPSNGSYLGFGCAYQKNVAAMLENPRDAVEARPATPPSADRRRNILTDYVDGAKSAAESQETTDTTKN